MKKITILFLLFIADIASAQSLDIISPFKMWLLNNEAKVMQSMSADMQLIENISQPFSFMQTTKLTGIGAEENIWNQHRKYYKLLDEIQGTYNIAKRFGNGKFAVVLKQARPEVWGIYALFNTIIIPRKKINESYRNAWHQTLLKTLELDSTRDYDLSGRLRTALSRLSKDEQRLFNIYLESFSALYPTNGSGKMIKSFLEQGTKANIGKGIIEILKLVDPNTDTTSVQFSGDIESALDQMEELAGLNNKTKVQTNNTAEDSLITSDFTERPDEGAEEDFNIW